MSHEHELFSELRQARHASKEAKQALKEAKEVLRKCERTIEDIMTEIDTGKALVNGRGGPLLDAINDAINVEQPAQPNPEPSSSEKFEWTSTDLEAVLAAACYVNGIDPDGVWSEMKRIGCDDVKIVEILRAIWPMTPQFRNDPPPGCTIRGERFHRSGWDTPGPRAIPPSSRVCNWPTGFVVCCKSPACRCCKMKHSRVYRAGNPEK